MKTSLLIIGGIAAMFIISFIAIIEFVGYSTEELHIQDLEKIYVREIKDKSYAKPADNYLNIDDMPPDSVAKFYYPNSENVIERDAFDAFIIIRLPESMGGAVDDVSAFRAYSALDLASHCLVSYWPEHEITVLQDPCHHNSYRIQDGYIVTGSNPARHPEYVALPHLDLRIDENGFLLVETPEFTSEKNGILGIGRNISKEQYQDVMISSFEEWKQVNPNIPDIPSMLSSGSHPVQIDEREDNTEIFFSKGAYSGIKDRFEIILQECDCNKLEGYPPHTRSGDSKLWIIDDKYFATRSESRDIDDSPRNFSAVFNDKNYVVNFRTNLDESEMMDVLLNSFYEDAVEEPILVKK